jgi:NAD(P)-dependent dehydrogenase (short-subunit alcohol dehydrogenase family)
MVAAWPTERKVAEETMGRLAGKQAIVTGGASGIGKGIAELFAREGAVVMVVDLDATRGQATAEAITEVGGRALFAAADVTRAVDCTRAVEKTVQAFGGLDILVNCAGIIRRASVLGTTEDEWDRVMAVNVKSVFLMSKCAIPPMVQRGGGVILNIASGWGLKGGRDAVAYCASKGAVVNMTRAMALDHAEQNIRVNCVCPGDTDTPMLREEARQLGQAEAQFLASSADRPLRRIGTPEDIAQAALYLASDAAAFVTGIALVVDGGGLAG